MKYLAHKKVVLVIVEGSSDDTALGIALDQIFDKAAVHIHILHGDITAKNGINSQNIISKIGDIISHITKNHHYKLSDFKQIIHIVDIDGVYIPDDNVHEDSVCNSPVYKENGIYTPNRKGIISRNQQKRDNLERLIATSKIREIPYKVYYMSCNLDHVLYNKMNSTDKEKEDDAYSFAKKYKNDVEGFIKFICDSYFSVINNYKDSWQHIKNGMNSVERYSNFGICIKEEIE